MTRGHQTGIFKSWEQCQKQTRGFKKADYKSFDTKKEAEEWLITRLQNKENHDEARTGDYPWLLSSVVHA